MKKPNEIIVIKNREEKEQVCEDQKLGITEKMQFLSQTSGSGAVESHLAFFFPGFIHSIMAQNNKKRSH